jgi:hypothetical protein
MLCTIASLHFSRKGVLESAVANFKKATLKHRMQATTEYDCLIVLDTRGCFS